MSFAKSLTFSLENFLLTPVTGIPCLCEYRSATGLK
jgi:hypothetical protein